MRVIIITLIIISSFNIYSQKFPMPADGASWDNSYADSDCQICPSTTTRVEVLGDTVISSIKYFKLFNTWKATYYMSGPCEFTYTNGPYYSKKYIAALRNDEDLHVYIITEGETEEKLLYDFSVSDGDSILLYDWGNQPYYSYINEIDSIMIGDSYRKRISLFSGLGAWDQWIEGIGSIHGLFATLGMCWEKCDDALICYQENGVQLYPVYYECNLCGMVTNLNSIKENIISVFPNPVTNNLSIDLPDDSELSSLRIYDLLGKIIYHQRIIEDKQIKISRKDLKQGLLLLEIAGANNICYRRKIIVQ